MRFYIKFNLAFLFGFLSLIFIILLFPHFNNNLKNDLKNNIADAGIYDLAVTELANEIDNSKENIFTDQATEYLTDVIKQEVSADYIKNKTEKFIDDTDSWINGINQDPPAISFLDIKTKILSDNAEMITALEEASREYNIRKEAIKSRAIENGEMTVDQEVPDFDFRSLITSDFSFPVGKNITWLKTLYQSGAIGAYVTGGLGILILICIIMMNETVKAKMRWAGTTFFFSFLVTGFFLLIIYLLQKGYFVLFDTQGIPVFFMLVWNAVVPDLIEKFTRFGEAVCGGFIVLFIICIASSFLIKTKRQPVVSPAEKIRKNLYQ